MLSKNNMEYDSMFGEINAKDCRELSNLAQKPYKIVSYCDVDSWTWNIAIILGDFKAKVKMVNIDEILSFSTPNSIKNCKLQRKYRDLEELLNNDEFGIKSTKRLKESGMR